MNKQTAGGIEMSDKMREAFEKEYKPLEITGVVFDEQVYAYMPLVKHYSLDLAKKVERINGQWDMWRHAWQASHAAALPPGFVAVPVEPTKAMIDAGRWMEFGEESSHCYPVDDESVIGVYTDMLSARPEVK